MVAQKYGKTTPIYKLRNGVPGLTRVNYPVVNGVTRRDWTSSVCARVRYYRVNGVRGVHLLRNVDCASK